MTTINPTPTQPETLEPNVHALTVLICQNCIDLKGEMCNNPQCVFCRRTMAEVQHYLDAMLLCPVVDGKRLILVGDAVTDQDSSPTPAPPVIASSDIVNKERRRCAAIARAWLWGSLTDPVVLESVGKYAAQRCNGILRAILSGADASHLAGAEGRDSATPPERTPVAGEQAWKCACGWHGTPSQMTVSNTLRTCPQCGGSGGLILDTTTADSARRAAEEILLTFPELKKHDKWKTIGRVRIDRETETETFERATGPDLSAQDRVAAIISKHLAPAPAESVFIPTADTGLNCVYNRHPYCTKAHCDCTCHAAPADDDALTQAALAFANGQELSQAELESLKTRLAAALRAAQG